MENSIVNVMIPSDIKERALDTLDRIGLSASDAVRLLFIRVAEEGRLPFALQLPSKAGIRETEYLLSNPANAARLMESMEQEKKGMLEEHDLIHFDDDDDD